MPETRSIRVRLRACVHVVTTPTMHFNRSNMKAVNTVDPNHNASEEVIALWLVKLCVHVYVDTDCV